VSPVVERFDVVEDGEARLLPGGPVVPVEEFGLQGGEEALGQGVVEAVAGRAHRPVDGHGGP